MWVQYSTVYLKIILVLPENKRVSIANHPDSFPTCDSNTLWPLFMTSGHLKLHNWLACVAFISFVLFLRPAGGMTSLVGLFAYAAVEWINCEFVDSFKFVRPGLLLSVCLSIFLSVTEILPIWAAIKTKRSCIFVYLWPRNPLNEIPFRRTAALLLASFAFAPPSRRSAKLTRQLK